MSVALELHGVRKRFMINGRQRQPLYRELLRLGRLGTTADTVAALDGVDLTLEKGARVGIVGRNGAGKTTLLRVIAGIHQAEEGTVRVNGTVGCLFGPKAGVMPTLSVLDNLFLNAAALGLSLQEARSGVDEVLSFAQIEDKRRTRLEQLSYGTAQRLFYGVTLYAMKLRKAEVYVFDEWLSGVDHRFREKGEQALLDALAPDETILIASHDVESLGRLCTHTVEMEGGKVVQFGPTQDVLERYLSDG